ncbi:transcription antitermination factor NusB [Aliicoccus persicus]|uniref:Transcription antitermination protein NusB n=1 Tax=Aliicoccus persicus TaxID=930138 RepID=A0A662Z2F9_9STAP|nr:transcription antitermination factor NusB [Aliicoccus persicus]SEV84297.1 NusB antitermination factor [Aliicoccus persicus]
MNRHEQRKKIFQIIFQLEDSKELMDSVKFKDAYNDYEYVKTVVDYYVQNNESIDNSISSYLQKFTIGRLSKVERSLLRMSFCEILLDHTPKKVVINETVILAKLYGDNDSFKFINGVLKSFIDSDHLDK